MAKTKRMARKSHKRHSKKRHMRRTRRGGGWEETGKYVPGAPGYQIHEQYPGPGKDCPGVFTRPGNLTHDLPGTGGLPGLNGKLFGGNATQLGSGGPVAGYVEPFRGEGGVAGAGRYGSATTTGAMQELKQMGGRYGFVPEVFNPKAGIVATPAGFGRIPCEVGTRDALNPNPNNIQTMSTAQGWVPGWTKYITGGKRKGKKTLKRKVRGGGVPEPTVTVGAVDTMRYYAPTAGYSTMPMKPPVAGNPGILIEPPYNARAFNQACIKTGGARKNKKVGGVDEEEEVVVEEGEVGVPENGIPATVVGTTTMNGSQAPVVGTTNMNGGAYPVAEMAGKFVPVDIKDYASGMLPVKFGGRIATNMLNTVKLGGGSFVASSPEVLHPTVGTLAGPAVGEQHIPITHNIPGATIYNGPVSKVVAGGKRSNKRRAKRSAKSNKK